ncbi:MAG: hypothetical protein WC683_20680 [bacterium]
MSGRITPREKAQCILFVLLGVGALVLKPAYHGPLEEPVYSYGGNVVVSFAVYFLAVFGSSDLGWGRLAAAGAALAAVEVFEITDGFFGVMSNTFDPYDLLANAAGIGVALAVDLLVRRGN